MKIISNGNDQQITVGLDIGSSTISCAIAQTIPSSKSVKLLGVSTTNSIGLKRGVIINRNKLIDALDKVLSDAELMAGVKVSSAILSITGDHIRSMNTHAAIALNRINATPGGRSERAINDQDIFQVLDLAQAVSLPSDRDILHTLPQEYLVDTLDEIKDPTGMFGRRLEGRVHLITAARTAMSNLVRCVEELGISVDGLVFQPLASGLATLESDEMELGVTLVEIGSSTTNIAIYHDNAVRHTAVIPIGASSITNDIAVMLQLSLNQAEKIKIKYASAISSMSSDMLNIDISSNNKISRSVSENEISKYVEARMQEIFNLIIREISRADIKDPLTYGIVMTGGGSELTNLITLAKNTLGVSVRRGSPIRIEGAEDVANKSYYATVMGLLLWPLYANDHVREQRSENQGLKGFIKKIRHTIEEYMF